MIRKEIFGVGSYLQEDCGTPKETVGTGSRGSYWTKRKKSARNNQRWWLPWQKPLAKVCRSRALTYIACLASEKGEKVGSLLWLSCICSLRDNYLEVKSIKTPFEQFLIISFKQVLIIAFSNCYSVKKQQCAGVYFVYALELPCGIQKENTIKSQHTNMHSTTKLTKKQGDFHLVDEACLERKKNIK